MLVAVVVLLIVIVVLLCLPQEQRGRALVGLIKIGALLAAIYYLGPVLLGLGTLGFETIRHSETARSFLRLLSNAIVLVLVGIPALFVLCVLAWDLWKWFRANPKQALRRLAVLCGKAVMGFAAFCLYIIGMIYVINRFYLAGLLIYLLVGVLMAMLFFVWRKKRSRLREA
jgi:hypothetical protein